LINHPGYPVLGRYMNDPNPDKIVIQRLAAFIAGWTPYIDSNRIGKVFYLDNTQQKVSEIYKEMFDRVVSENNLNQNKVAIDSHLNEITRMLCRE
jgi:hypothetical protein